MTQIKIIGQHQNAPLPPGAKVLLAALPVVQSPIVCAVGKF
jgi:hypothetical protein